MGGNVITVLVTAEDGSTTASYTIDVTRAANANAELSALVLSEGILAPDFAPGTTSYTASVANAIENLTVTPTTSDAGATVSVNGQPVASGNASSAIALNVGENTIIVVVTAADLTTTKTYGIVVTRAGTPEIVVEQPAGTDLQDGASTIGFGAGPIGSAATTKTFTIRNTGNCGAHDQQRDCGRRRCGRLRDRHQRAERQPSA